MIRIARAADVGARQAWLLRNRLVFGRPIERDRPRLFVDVSAIMRHDAQTGIQRVVRSVWSDLCSRRNGGFQVLPVFATNTHGYCYAPVDFIDRPARAASSDPVSVCPGDKVLGLDLSAHLLPKYRRQLRAWRRCGATIHLVVYDLLPMLRPEWFSDAAVNNFGKWLEVLTQDADQAICISDQVARDLLQTIGGSGGPAIGRLQMGGDIAASIPSKGLCPDVERLLDRLRFRPAILMVGTIEPRKGYDVALAAFEHLWRSRPTDAPDLVIVGKGGWKTADLQARLRAHPEQGRRLYWFDRMSDEGLCRLYEATRGVFMPSRAEGFGLPLIEAAMHRRHVLARDLAVFREQRLPNVFYFDDDHPAEIAERLMSLVRTAQKYVAPIPHLPSWSDCVDGLLAEIGLAGTKNLQAGPRLWKAS